MEAEQGLADALKEILESNQERVSKFINEENQLLLRIDFYESHNLQEEKRIALIKYEALSKVLYRYKTMVADTQVLLDKWNS
jgi:hypothetical protein